MIPGLLLRVTLPCTLGAALTAVFDVGAPDGGLCYPLLSRVRYAAGYWYLGKKNELGKSQGWLCVRDPAPAPELVQQIWRAGETLTLKA